MTVKPKAELLWEVHDEGKAGRGAGIGMSVEMRHTGFQTGEIERVFAEKLISRGAAGFAGRRKTCMEKGPAARAKKRTENGLAAGICIRNGEVFVKRIQNRGGALFAAHILKRRPSFDEGGFYGTVLVHKREPSFCKNMNSVQKIFMQFRATWNYSALSEQKRLICQKALAQSIAERLTRYVKPVKMWHGGLRVEKELTVFRDIASIFVNRGSRPDLAKKAERDLVKILSREFFEHTPDSRAHEQNVLQRKNVQEELVLTKRTLATLEEQVKQQKTLLIELNRKLESAARPAEWNAGMLTGEVMKRMEKEMHLERLRKGL